MKTYYRLTKPGIVYGNAIPAIAAFIFASSQHVSVPLFLAMLVGLSLCIASSCVINNVIDRDIDTRMERTKARAIPAGKVSVRNALIFAGVLGIVGIAILYFFTNLLTLLVTLFGVFVYLALYTPAKRITPHSTIIGALSGAVPPVVGYVAVTNTLDATAFLLFLILVCWQMTHFFAIGIFRLKDYAAAKLPVMPVYLGILRTKVLMVIYAFLFAYAAFALFLVEQLGLVYSVPVGIFSIGWVVLGVSGFYAKDDSSWARRTFSYSIILLLVFSISLALS